MKVTITMEDGTVNVFGSMPIDFDSCNGASAIKVELGAVTREFSGHDLFGFSFPIAGMGGQKLQVTVIGDKIHDDGKGEGIEFTPDGQYRERVFAEVPSAAIANTRLRAV